MARGLKKGQTHSGSMKKGETRNPNGRPPSEFSIKQQLKEILQGEANDTEKTAYQLYEEKVQRVKAMAHNMVKTAATVDPTTGVLSTEGVNMSKFLAEMFDGKAHQQTDITSKGENIQGLTVVVPSLEVIHSEESEESV